MINFEIFADMSKLYFGYVAYLLSYHRSELVSYPSGSAPGGCKIEMQTRPSG